SLTISNSQFVNNIAKPLSAITSPSDNGGAIHVAENCDGARTTPVTITIASSVFTGNRVQPVDVVGFGGAITTFSYADFAIVDSRIVDNHIDVPNPPVANQNYHGGGIYGAARSVRIERTEVSSNSVIDTSVGAGGANDATRGGGLGFVNDIPDLQAPASAIVLSIVDSTISGNAVSAVGGGLWVY